jgi:hypothetical protein
MIADRKRIVARLCDFASRPSVSADPAFAKGMTDARSFLTDRLGALGFAATSPSSTGQSNLEMGLVLHAVRADSQSSVLLAPP